MAPFVSPNHSHSIQTSMSRFGGTSEIDYLNKNMTLSNQRSPSSGSTTPGDQSPRQTSPQSPTRAYSKVARSAAHAFDTAHGGQHQGLSKTSHPLSIESRYDSPASTPGPSSSSPWPTTNSTSNLANSATKAHDYYLSPLSSPFTTAIYSTPAHQYQLPSQKEHQQSQSHASYSTVDNPALVITERVLKNATGYALRRDNGTYTRLVALDELPQIIGISATLQGPQGCIIVPVPGFPQPLKNLQWVGGVPSVTAPPSTPSSNGSFRHYDAFSSAGHIPCSQGVRSVSNSGPSMGGALVFRSFNAQQPRKEKIYCDKWVHDGVCAFAQQGCKYKHEMPMDVATQRSLGLFHGLPAWWKREHGAGDFRRGSQEGRDGGRKVSVENARQTLKGLLVSSAANGGAQYGVTAGGGSGVNATLSSWRIPQGPVHGPGKSFGQAQPQNAAHGGLYGNIGGPRPTTPKTPLSSSYLVDCGNISENGGGSYGGAASDGGLAASMHAPSKSLGNSQTDMNNGGKESTITGSATICLAQGNTNGNGHIHSHGTTVGLDGQSHGTCAGANSHSSLSFPRR